MGSILVVMRARDISLIMECMHMDLEHCMKSYPNIPVSYKTSILREWHIWLTPSQDTESMMDLNTDSCGSCTTTKGTCIMVVLDYLIHCTLYM